MVSVYALRLDVALSEAALQLLLNQTAKEKRERIQKFYRRGDALRCLFADLLIRYILIQQHGLKQEEIAFSYSSYGKPSIIGYSNIYFNVAHSGEWVVCAVAEKAVGIDVEAVRSIDLEIADTYFSKEEKQQLFSLSSQEQLPFFYKLWTLKESYIKMKGKGLSIPLDAFTIFIDGQGNIKIDEGEVSSSPIYLKQHSIDEQYKMAACSYSALPDNVIVLQMQEIAGFFEKMEGL